MNKKNNPHLTLLEWILVICLIFFLIHTTFGLCHFLINHCLYKWFEENETFNTRIIYYGVAFGVSIAALLINAFFSDLRKAIDYSPNQAFEDRRFLATLLFRIIPIFGVTLFSASTIVFLFDCLPPLASGISGAIVFTLGIYAYQRFFCSREQVTRMCADQMRCRSCDARLKRGAEFCSACGEQVGKRCSKCSSPVHVEDSVCWKCRS